MGARISLAGPPRGTYLIIGSDPLPEDIAERNGGITVLRLNGHKLLAVLPFKAYLALKNDRRVNHIGPVTIDIKRLTAIAGRLAAPFTPRPAGA